MLKKFRSGNTSPKSSKNQKHTQETIGSPVQYLEINLIMNQTQISEHEQQLPFQICDKSDDYRSQLAHESGGFVCSSKKQVEKLRSVGKQMIKLIGKKILSGQLNLTKISFPIKACANKTALRNSIDYCVVFPHFMNLAASKKDPLERFKLTVTTILSAPHYIDMFLKPLNPIIGETLQAELKDGTKIYCEQISHHPPISYFLIYGPNQSYQFSGYYDFEISPGLNSLSLKNIGKRKFVFRDGTTITASYPTGQFSNTFFGTSRIEQIGECLIEDHKNQIELLVQFGKMKKKPTDFYQSEIIMRGKKVAAVKGTYCGFIDFDEKRYWDARHYQAFELLWPEKKRLPSDWSLREDLKFLIEEKIEQAQQEKQRLEHIQRTDQKLRKKHRKQGHQN